MGSGESDGGGLGLYVLRLVDLPPPESWRELSVVVGLSLCCVRL